MLLKKRIDTKYGGLRLGVGWSVLLPVTLFFGVHTPRMRPHSGVVFDMGFSGLLRREWRFSPKHMYKSGIQID